MIVQCETVSTLKEAFGRLTAESRALRFGQSQQQGGYSIHLSLRCLSQQVDAQ